MFLPYNDYQSGQLHANFLANCLVLPSCTAEFHDPLGFQKFDTDMEFRNNPNIQVLNKLSLFNQKWH